MHQKALGGPKVSLRCTHSPVGHTERPKEACGSKLKLFGGPGDTKEVPQRAHI